MKVCIDQAVGRQEVPGMAEDVHSLGDAHAEREMFFANSCFLTQGGPQIYMKGLKSTV